MIGGQVPCPSYYYGGTRDLSPKKPDVQFRLDVGHLFMKIERQGSCVYRRNMLELKLCIFHGSESGEFGMGIPISDFKRGGTSLTIKNFIRHQFSPENVC